MTKLERLEKIGESLEGMLLFDRERFIHYGLSENLRDDIPKEVQQSLVIQKIADDKRILRDACIPFVVKEEKKRQQGTKIIILI